MPAFLPTLLIIAEDINSDGIMARRAAPKKKKIKPPKIKRKIKPARVPKAPARRRRAKGKVAKRGLKIRLPKWIVGEKKVAKKRPFTAPEMKKMEREITARVEKRKKEIDWEMYEKLGKISYDWRRFLSESITKEMRTVRRARPGGRFTLDQFVMAALSSRRPVKKETPEETQIMRRVAKKIVEMPEVKPRPAIAAVELGMLQNKATERGVHPELINYKKWAHKKVV